MSTSVPSNEPAAERNTRTQRKHSTSGMQRLKWSGSTCTMFSNGKYPLPLIHDSVYPWGQA